jgi:hypothetical protein
MNRATLSVIIIIAALLILTPGCARLTTDIVPDASSVYHSLRIKVTVKNNKTGERGSFRILLKYNDTRDKMLFLSPLNQVYGLLVVDGETALLINNKRKRYWTGPFYILLREIWGPGMDFEYDEFKRLMVTGTVPDRKLKQKHITISIEKKDPDGKPAHLKIITPDVSVKIKLSNRVTRSGRIRFNVDLDSMIRSGIGEVLE